jgi:hypothetical protein
MYVRVSPARPCPICGHDSWCLVSRKGKAALCQRIESPDRKGDAGFFHKLDRPVHVPPEAIQEPADRIPPDVIETLVMGWMADLRPQRLYTLAQQLGVTPGSLNRLNIGWNERLECFTFPMRNAEFEYVGASYRFPDGEKRSLKGGTSGLFLPLSTVGGHKLFVCEGATDCAAMLDCGLDAIGRPANNCGSDDVVALVDKFRPRAVVIVCDHDRAGSQAAKMTDYGRDQLRDKLKALPFKLNVAMIRPAQHKDARECIRAGGRRETILGALGVADNRFWEMHN